MTQPTECITVDLPADVVEFVRNAVPAGEYASSKRIQAHAALKRDIDRGLEDITQGRAHDFSERHIVEQGEDTIGGPLALRVAEAAECDLAVIWAYLATEASQDIATTFIRNIESAFQPLLYFPLSGHARNDLAAGLRVVFRNSYAISYKPESLSTLDGDHAHT